MPLQDSALKVRDIDRKKSVRSTSTFLGPNATRRRIPLSIRKSVFLILLWLLAYPVFWKGIIPLPKFASLHEALHGLFGNRTQIARLDGAYRDTIPRTKLVAKITTAYESLTSLEERALDRQIVHAEMHGYATFILRSKMTDRMSNRLAYVLSTILRELEKPVEQRIGWLFCFDPDVLILNPNIPLETYLPPPEMDRVHVLMTHDDEGFNTATFFVRINSWSAELMIEALAMATLQSKLKVPYTEKRALELLVNETRNQVHTVWVPPRWFNAFQGMLNDEETNPDANPGAARRGDLQVQFTGRQASENLMARYMENAEHRDPLWEISLDQTGLEGETKLFWSTATKVRKLMRMSDHFGSWPRVPDLDALFST